MGGIVFEWARKTIFGPDQTAEDFINVAETVPAGSNGLIFHPYLGGRTSTNLECSSSRIFYWIKSKPH